MAFRARLKVRFGDIDNAGIVYYPRFVHYFHVALEEFFNTELRIDYAKVFQKHRIAFPTVHLETDFRQRLRHGDRIEVEVKVLKIGRTSITIDVRVCARRRRNPELDVNVTEADVVFVAVDEGGKPVPVIPNA